MSAYYRNLRPDVAALLPPRPAGARVLDIGCGAGAFRGHFPDDCEYWGIEPVDSAAADAARVMDRVLTGTFDEVCDRLPDQYFDCVVCNDVIEHMANEDRFLHAVRRTLRPGAVLVGSVPNVRFVWNLLRLLVRRDWEYVDEGVLDRTHLRFFTRRSLQRCFERNGYAAERLVGLNPVGFESGGLVPGLRSTAVLVLSVALGLDSRFMQYGFVVRPLPPTSPVGGSAATSVQNLVPTLR